jgi:hypothetical protein
MQRNLKSAGVLRKLLIGVSATIVSGALMLAGTTTASAAVVEPPSPESDQARANSALFAADAQVAAEATTAASPYFRIFYGQNCYSGGTGSRYYLGYNSGEAWINDKFNEGGVGNGQYIRQNAASVFVWAGTGHLWLSTDNGYSFAGSYSATGTCYNLGTNMRNRNTYWMVTSY